MALLISVAPAGEGWAVESDVLDESLFFPSGGRAEAAARALAQQTAAEGRTAELRITLRDGALGGAFLYPSQSTPSAMAC